MKTEEYKELTELLCKLGREIKAHRFCIIPQYLHEGCHIGIYNAEGDCIKSISAIDIPEAVKQLQEEQK